jgi:hypothetical protein
VQLCHWQLDRQLVHVATRFRRSSVRSGTDSAKCVGCDMKVVSGDPDPKPVSNTWNDRI